MKNTNAEQAVICSYTCTQCSAVRCPPGRADQGGPSPHLAILSVCTQRSTCPSKQRNQHNVIATCGTPTPLQQTYTTYITGEKAFATSCHVQHYSSRTVASQGQSTTPTTHNSAAAQLLPPSHSLLISCRPAHKQPTAQPAGCCRRQAPGSDRMPSNLPPKGCANPRAATAHMVPAERRPRTHTNAKNSLPAQFRGLLDGGPP